MGFDKRKNAKRYQHQDGDTLKSIAERETSAGNAITWQDIAKFNWGTDDIDEINEYMRDELGCRLRDADNNFIISADDEPQGELLIPILFKKTNLALDKLYVLRVHKKVSPPQFIDCATIPGVTFEFNKSFVRPSVVEQIKTLEQTITTHPEAKIIIFGHTDKVGQDSYNKALSERRALSVFAFITDDVDTWEKLYNEEDWGIIVIQQILADFGGEFDPGPVDGINGPKTKTAVKNYQAARGLTVDGVAGPNTRKQMFTEYMTGKHNIKLKPDQFIDPKYMGCGEYNPVKPTEEAHEPNRRVMFYLFNKDRPPKLPCKLSDLNPCEKQKTPPSPRFRNTFLCSFYDSLAHKCPLEAWQQAPLARLYPAQLSQYSNVAARLEAVSGSIPPETTTLELGGQRIEHAWMSDDGFLYFIPPSGLKETYSQVLLVNTNQVCKLEKEVKAVDDPVDIVRSLGDQMIVLNEGCTKHLEYDRNNNATQKNVEMRYYYTIENGHRRLETALDNIEYHHGPLADAQDYVDEIDVLIKKSSESTELSRKARES